MVIGEPEPPGAVDVVVVGLVPERPQRFLTTVCPPNDDCVTSLVEHGAVLFFVYNNLIIPCLQHGFAEFVLMSIIESKI